MKIVAQDNFRWIQEYDRLVREYIAEHKDEKRGPAGISRRFGRLRLELAAWTHASREIRKRERSLYKLYVGR